MKNSKHFFYIFGILVALVFFGCKQKPNNILQKEEVPENISFEKGTFGYDKNFLKEYYPKTLVLENLDKSTGIAIVPELQGRVMTSKLAGDAGMGFGWLNYDFIQSKKVNEKFNPVGGEERFWLGPEGGQFAYFFEPGSTFDFTNWRVPASIDREPFDIVEKKTSSVAFKKKIHLVNYSGAEFHIEVQRTIKLLDNDAIKELLGLKHLNVTAVGYETDNTLTNVGKNEWKRETGLPSIWLLGMFISSPETTVVIPIKEGASKALGKPVNDDYFGKVPDDRLITTPSAIFFKADGNYRSKIGVSPLRANTLMGSYDAKHNVLTILQIKEPNQTEGYVNSAWKLQEDPYNGDVLNSYNDGKLEDGSQMGPFYELESSSPALALQPNESYSHIQKTYHLTGSKTSLDSISKEVFGVNLEAIVSAFNSK